MSVQSSLFILELGGLTICAKNVSAYFKGILEFVSTNGPMPIANTLKAASLEIVFHPPRNGSYRSRHGRPAWEARTSGQEATCAALPCYHKSPGLAQDLGNWLCTVTKRLGAFQKCQIKTLVGHICEEPSLDYGGWNVQILAAMTYQQEEPQFAETQRTTFFCRTACFAMVAQRMTFMRHTFGEQGQLIRTNKTHSTSLA